MTELPDTSAAVFFADLDALSAVIERVPRVDLDEAQRYTRARRRRQFLAGRALARLALEHRCALAFDAIRFERIGDAPLVAGQPEIALSLSHSGEGAGCAIATARACGFDLQHEVEKPLLEIAGSYFVPHEHAALAALAPPARARYFYRCWVLKEAWAKASGSALFDVLARVGPAPDAHSASNDWDAWVMAPSEHAHAALVMAAGSGHRAPEIAVWDGQDFAAATMACERVGLAVRSA